MPIDTRLFTPAEIEIFERDHYRCVHCGHSGEVIHELEPRSRRPKDWQVPENRVTLDALCHAWAHQVSCKVSAPILRADLRRNLDRICT